MPYAPEHKQHTRRRIVRSARRLFNQRGFNEVSIDEIMANAQLTRGGFYAHFRNKEELYVEAITLILEENPATEYEGMEFDFESEDIARVIVNAYLSRQHYDDIEGSCPLIALPNDVARGSQTLQRAYRQVLGSMVDIFKQKLNAHSDAESQALAMAALCVGGMVLARAVGDEQMADEIREASRQHALQILGPVSTN